MSKIELQEAQMRLDKKYPNEYTIVEYDGFDKDSLIRHNECGFEFIHHVYNLYMQGAKCPVCYNNQKQTKESFARRFYNIFKDEYSIVGEYKDSKTPIRIRHNKCNTEFERTPVVLLSRKKCTCKKCNPTSNNTFIKGINDITTLRPDIAELLTDKEDSCKYSVGSAKSVNFTCPNCGEILYRKISYVCRDGLHCRRCNDGISYPEKFFFSLLRQLNINFDYQFRPEWANGKMYDFEFIIMKKKYVVELDGAFHHRETSITNLSEISINDLNKDLMAQQHGYEVIRIDCNYNNMTERYRYMKNSITNSDFSELIDLSLVDFDKCDKDSLNSIIIQVANDWNSGMRGIPNYVSKYQLNRTTIRTYLYQASDAGLISDSRKEICNQNREYSYKTSGDNKGTSVLCNETGEIFPSYAEAARKYHCALFNYFRVNAKYSGKLPDGTKLTWTKI